MREEFNFDESVSKAHLEAAGWDMECHHHSNPFESHVVYVRDYRSNHTQLFTVRQDDFDRVSLPFGASELSSVVSVLMEQVAYGSLTEERSEQLGPALAGYVKATQTYGIWRRDAGPTDPLHALINIYPEGYLRPFIVPAPKTVLSAEQVRAYTEQVREIDVTNHPEWFAKAH